MPSFLALHLFSSLLFSCLLPRSTTHSGSLSGIGRKFDLPPAAGGVAGALDTGAAVVEVVLAGVDVLEDALGDAHEGSLDVLAALGARLDVGEDAVAGGPLLRLGGRDLALVVVRRPAAALALLPLFLLPDLVELVPYQDDDDVGLGDLAQVVEPVGRVLEGALPRDVEDEERA